MKRIWIILVIAVLALGWFGYRWWSGRAASSENAYITATVTKGDVQELIPATGTLEPVDSVDIGAQVAGIITSLGDPSDKSKTIDFRSVVKKGDILATIDDSLYQADLKQANAEYDSANANLAVAQANLLQDEAKLEEADADWARAQKLGPGEALAQTTYDSYKATDETAKAQVAVGQAAVKQAQAAIAQAEADQFRAKRNVNYCVITSPVDGTVIDRRVDIGQTVVSSLNAPSLFLIGTDMSKMQIWVSVDEADIPRIKEGMPVLFDVDGINHTFQGTVNKVRWNATMTQNVVTYTVEVNADNPEGTLIPYRTANVRFLVSELKDVLLVPDAALLWRPKNFDPSTVPGLAAAPAGAAGSAAASGSAAGSGGTGRGGRRGANGQGGNAGGKPKQSLVFVLENGQPKPVVVQTGITDEVNTAIMGGDLKESDIVITGQPVADQGGSGGTTNPFAPTPSW